MILVTGGAGFIGSSFAHEWLEGSYEPVVNLDALTYAGNLANLAGSQADPRHVFMRGDICDRAMLECLFREHRPRAVLHFAAETHVDRGIHGPRASIRANVEASFKLLEAARIYWTSMAESERGDFRFLYVSTDGTGSMCPTTAAH